MFNCSVDYVYAKYKWIRLYSTNIQLLTSPLDLIGLS